MVHHWVGLVFIPGTTLAKVIPTIQDYGHRAELYKPDVIAARARYTQVAKEHGGLAKKVKPYLEYKQLAQEIAQTEVLAAEGDAEIQRYAEEELGKLRGKGAPALVPVR